MQIYSPVLLTISHNPENAWRSFEVIKKLKPSDLYVAGRQNEIIKIVSEVDWPCKTEKRLLDNGESPLSWLFSKADEGIIVKDNCVPDSSFFYFAQAMLERYRAKKEVIMINGSNPEGSSKSKFSYFFSHVCVGCALASWKRAWLSHQTSLKILFNKGFYISDGGIMSIVPKTNLIELQNNDTPIIPLAFPLDHQIVFNIESKFDKSARKKLKS